VTLAPPTPWLSAALLLGAFLAWIAGLKLYARLATPPPERLRKLLHTGSGLLTLSFPWLFDDPAPVLVLCGLSASLLLGVKLIPAIRHRLGHVVNGVDRETLGEVYFPIAVAALFVLALRDQVAQGAAATFERRALLFTIPILVLTLADAVGALIGVRYGQHRYTGSAKSLEGSVAFFFVAFLSVHVPLLLFSGVGRVETLLIATTLALLVMVLEGSAWRGLDNLFIPIGGFFLLRAYLGMDAAMLWPRIGVTIGLVALVLTWRSRTTLEDSALLAGVFIGYVTWALGGWRWLVPPAIVFVAYTLLSPRTTANSQRIHDPYAILSVCSAGLAWLAAARLSGRAELYYPYTLAFASHLALIGIARIAYDRPSTPLAPIIALCIVKGSLLILLPFALLAGATTHAATLAIAGTIGVALAALLFTWLQPDVRNCTLDGPRWWRQAASAAVGSMVGLLVMRIWG